MGNSEQSVREAGTAAVEEATARARATRNGAAALCAEAHQRRRRVQITAIVRRADRIERELRALHLEFDLWDAIHPPLQHLTERLETVEAGLDEIEARLRALRGRPAD